MNPERDQPPRNLNQFRCQRDHGPGIFGTGNVIDASMAFGLRPWSTISDLIWFMNYELPRVRKTNPERADEIARSIRRGERLLRVLTRRYQREFYEGDAA